MWIQIGLALLWTVLVFFAGFISGGHNAAKAEKYAAMWKTESDKWEARAKLFFEGLSKENKEKLGK